MKKRKNTVSLHRRSHLIQQRRANVRKRQRLANRRQLSQWTAFYK